VEINVVLTYRKRSEDMDIVVGVGGEDDRKETAN
jgi:hypothetical protein